MNNQPHKKNSIIIRPFRAVTVVIIGMVILLFSYLYCNYAAAATVPVELGLTDKISGQRVPIHTHVIVYRVDGDTWPASKKVVNVFLDNQYHTSILPHNRAVELILCPGTRVFDISIGQLDQYRFGRAENVKATSSTLLAGKRYFYQIGLNDQKEITARWVSEHEVQKAPFKLKAHLLTQVNVTSGGCLS